MPGITGIIRKSRSDAIEADLDLMVSAMRHDTHSKKGTFIDEAMGLWVGWVCHPGSYADCMPLVARNDDAVIVFVGEHYPSHEQLDHLRRVGIDVEQTDASYLLGLYAAYGNRFYAELNGWFSGVLLDRRENSITLFNDRYAMGRIYYHESTEEFLFSSEAKSLLRIRPKLRKLCNEALAEHLKYNCVLGNRSLFADVWRLPPASAWSFRNGATVKRGQYFTFREWERQPALGKEEFYRRWAMTVSEVFPGYADGRGEVAISLTAGLDTRLVIAVLRELNRVHPVYTFDGPWGELFDVSTARKLARIYDQRFHVIRADTVFLRNFGEYAARAIWISDGCHDAFGAHDVFLNEAARDIAPIRLTGKFGSEIVRVRRLLGTVGYKRGLLHHDLHRIVERLPKYDSIGIQRDDLTRVIIEEIPSHEYGRVAVEQAYLTLRTPYMDNALVRLMYQAPKGSRAAGDLQEAYVRDFAPELGALMTNLGRFASSSPLITGLAFYPFWALFKMEYIYLMATPHWVTRVDRLLENLHPERLFSGRQKWEGYRIWIRSHFADFIQDTLLNAQAEYTEHFDYAMVSRMVRRHVAGTHNYLLEINRALSVQLVYSSLLKI